MSDDSLPSGYMRAVGVPDNAMDTEGFDYQVRWEPYSSSIDCTASFRCTRLSDGAVRYFHLVPSSSGQGAPDVFLYEGESADPGQCNSVCFVVPNFPPMLLPEEVRLAQAQRAFKQNPTPALSTIIKRLAGTVKRQRRK
jgi:hypothetical protein